MDLKVLATYPFLPEASRYVGVEGPPLEEVLEHRAFEAARTLGREKVFEALRSGALPDPPLTSQAEYLSSLYAYPLARILVSCVGDSFLIRRFALAEASRARRLLSRESEDFILQVCHSLGLNAGANGSFRLRFTDFLRATRRLRGKEWKLVNHPVEEGYVLLERAKFLRVLEGHLRNRFGEELPLEVNDVLLDHFRETVRSLSAELAARKPNLAHADLGPLRVTSLPPCMQKLLGSVLASENVSHPGRFALVAFLNNLGLSPEEIFRIFASVPDFRESITRYQIEHITGQISGTVYTAPECSTMKSYGICPGPDRLCQTIRHPLSYYRKKAGVRSRPRQTAQSPTRA